MYMECCVCVLVTMTTSRQEWRQFVWDDIIHVYNGMEHLDKGYPWHYDIRAIDMYSFSSFCLQIGRSADSAINMVVVETVTGADGKRAYRANSTVSRYACRIQCERSPPYSARLFAAAFDTSGKIKLSVRESYAQWDINCHDGRKHYLKFKSCLPLKNGWLPIWLKI